MVQEKTNSEPWLRGTMADVPVVVRAVLHALELATEDLERWCAPLTDDQLNARPCGLAPVSFHLRHIPRSIDRLLTYAEGRQLSSEQLSSLKAELQCDATAGELWRELTAGLRNAAVRIGKLTPEIFEEPRVVGRQQLPTTVGGLLVHIAEHTQRHVGQAITTAKIVANSDF
jgi:uncharacterized damage-inducible protein DinB